MNGWYRSFQLRLLREVQWRYRLVAASNDPFVIIQLRDEIEDITILKDKVEEWNRSCGHASYNKGVVTPQAGRSC